MKIRGVAVLACCLAAACIDASTSYAEEGRPYKHADKNLDGRVSGRERREERRWEAEQRRVSNWWEKRADVDRNGVVDQNELAAWKSLTKEHFDSDGNGIIDAKERRLCWRHARSKVNTPLEVRFDEDGDGWLSTDEIKALLKDRAGLVKSGGTARVESIIEEGYDADNDGVLNASEAEAMVEDAQ